MGRVLEVTLKSGLSNKRVYNICKDYFLKGNCDLIEERPYSVLAFKGGSRFWTYVLGTSRWEKAVKDIKISISSKRKESIVKIRYDVSWLTSISLKERAAGRELYRLSKLLKAEITGIHH